MMTADLDSFGCDLRSAVQRHWVLFLIPGIAMVILGLAQPPHAPWQLERRSAVCRGYVVDFARSGLSQRQNSD
jgi:hypothetical protein